MQSHRQACQRPDRPSAGDDAIGGTRCPGQHVGDRFRPLRGHLGDRGTLPRGQAVPGVQLASDPRRSERHTGHGVDRRDRTDAGLEASSAEIQPEYRGVPHPDPGPLTEEAQPGLLLARQQGDGAPEDPLHPGEKRRAVPGVTQCGGGERHDHVGTGVLGRAVEPLDGAHRQGRPVPGDPTGARHLGAQVQERTAAEHRLEATVTGRVDHHEVERATAQVEYGYTHGGHRRDAIPPPRGSGCTRRDGLRWSAPPGWIPGTWHHGAWRSLVARLLWEQEVLGSNPGAPTINR